MILRMHVDVPLTVGKLLRLIGGSPFSVPSPLARLSSEQSHPKKYPFRAFRRACSKSLLPRPLGYAPAHPQKTCEWPRANVCRQCLLWIASPSAAVGATPLPPGDPRHIFDVLDQQPAQRGVGLLERLHDLDALRPAMLTCYCCSPASRPTSSQSFRSCKRELLDLLTPWRCFRLLATTVRTLDGTSRSAAPADCAYDQ
jgi:hypothetical protein